MKRRLVTILFFLLLGAVVNVAVAWCHAWIHHAQHILERREWGWPFDTLYRGPRVSIEFLEAHIPYQPVWPGFAANTIFYAFILWLFIRGPFVLRRYFRREIRRWRGCCLMCGYDLRGLPPDRKCPECGWGREEVST